MMNIAATNTMRSRPVRCLKVTELANDLPEPQNIVVELSIHNRPKIIDVGSLAYSATSRDYRQITKDRGHSDVITSLVPSRIDFVELLLDHILIKGGRHISIDRLFAGIRNAFNWSDNNNHSNFLDTEDLSSECYRQYTDHLFHRMHISEITPITASGYQASLAKAINLHWSEKTNKNLLAGIRRIPPIRVDADPVEKKHVINTVQVYLHIARGYGDFILENKAFPFKLTMPDYETYQFPTNYGTGVMTPYHQPRAPAAFNFKEGRLNTFEEIGSIYKQGKAKSNPMSQDRTFKRALKDTIENLEKINNNPRDPARLSILSKSMQAYMHLFVIVTGIQPSELLQVEHSDDTLNTERSAIQKSYRAIKFRANGLEVVYDLGSKLGLTILKEYLKLRAWFLDGQEFRYLFFTLRTVGARHTGEYDQISMAFVMNHHKFVSGLFLPAHAKRVTSRQVRNYKSAILHAVRAAPEEVADVLNHTVATNLTKYTPCTEEARQSQFGTFWGSARAAADRIKVVDTPEGDDTSIATGHCQARNHPTPESDSVPIEPDCNKQYGCLYCKNYLCHADYEDVHKLLSLQYVIDSVRRLPLSISKADEKLSELYMRIGYIIKQVEKRSDTAKEITKKAKIDVLEHGILTVFWELRLQRYEQMGVVLYEA